VAFDEPLDPVVGTPFNGGCGPSAAPFPGRNPHLRGAGPRSRLARAARAVGQAMARKPVASASCPATASWAAASA